MSAEQSWRRHTNKPPGAVSKCPPSSLPAGLAVMDGDVSCVRKVLERGLQKLLWSQLDPTVRGGAWGSSCWLFELGRGLL